MDFKNHLPTLQAEFKKLQKINSKNINKIIALQQENADLKFLLNLYLKHITDKSIIEKIKTIV